MSSDPIEVLRELAARWHRAAVNCHECGKPSQARVFRACAAQVTSALAPLSAPKPPPMNDNAVAVNESAPVNDKPESAMAAFKAEAEAQKARAERLAEALRGGVTMLERLHGELWPCEAGDSVWDVRDSLKGALARAALDQEGGNG